MAKETNTAPLVPLVGRHQPMYVVKPFRVIAGAALAFLGWGASSLGHDQEDAKDIGGGVDGANRFFGTLTKWLGIGSLVAGVGLAASALFVQPTKDGPSL